MFITVSVISYSSREDRRSPTFVIKKNGNLVETEAGAPAAGTLGSPGEMQEFPTLAFCMPKSHNFEQKKIKGANPDAPANLTQTLLPVPTLGERGLSSLSLNGHPA